MLNSLFTRQRTMGPNGSSVDAYGRISRAYVDTWAGVYVDTQQALAVPGVWRATTLISDAIGGLPLQAYKDGKPIATPPVLSRPNPPETRVETITAAVAAAIIHGNFVAVLGPAGANGYPDSIYPISPERVRVKMVDGRKVYEIDEMKFDQSEIMHVKGFSLPGELVGVGILTAQRQGLGSSIALHEYAARYFNGGTTPAGILYSSNPDLTEEEAQLLKQKWLSHYGGRSREPAVLNESIKFEPVSDNAGDAQLVEQRQFDLTEIANMLGLPGYYLGAPNSSRTYSNVQEEQLQLLRFSLLPWINRFEQAFSDLLPRGQTAKFNVDAFLRADTLTRYQAHEIGLRAGFLTPGEVRTLEDLQPLEEMPDYEQPELEPAEMPDDTLEEGLGDD